MKKSILIVATAIAMIGCGSAKHVSGEATASKETVKTIDPTIYGNLITSEELKEMLYTYASDEFEGRETGEPGQKMAVEYLKEKYVSMDIPSPISKDDYFQEVPLVKQSVPMASVNVNGKVYKSFEDLVAMAGDNGTIDAKEIVYAGYGIETDSYSDYKDLDVKGKVVLVKAGEPKKQDGTYVTSGTPEPTKWTNGRQALASKRNLAIDKGAKAFILMDAENFPRYSEFLSKALASNSPGRLSLKSNEETMAILMVNETMGKALYADILINDTPKAVTATVNITIENKAEEVISENVVAFIKGTEKPNEIIVISAHLDHEGIKDGEIYNGADDDGSGTVAIVEIAESFKKASDDGYGPRRSLLFLHVTGEEKGLLGSQYYTDYDPIFPLAHTMADLNIDMIGRVDKKHEQDKNYVYLIGSDKLSTDLHNISEEVNTKFTNITLDYTYNDDNDPNRFYYRSDHYNFAKNNIPVIFYFNGTHDDYHRPSDTPDKIEYELLQNRTRLVFYTAWELANRDDKIVVDKASE